MGLEPTQYPGEHLAGDAADQLDQLAMAYWALTEAVEHDHRPLVDDLGRASMSYCLPNRRERLSLLGGVLTGIACVVTQQIVTRIFDLFPS